MYCKNCGHQVNEDKKFCKNCGTTITVPQSTSTRNLISLVEHSQFIKWAKQYKKQLIIGVVALVLISIALAISVSAKKGSVSSSMEPTSVSSDTIASFVVDIICPTNNGGGSGGSGTIMNSEGVILTNNHIIPEDKKGNPTVSKCIITLADSHGKIKNIYTGSPRIIPKLSLQEDLAFIEIDGSFTDDDGTTWGEYPTTFPNFVDSGCSNNDPKLGEPVRIYGYPTVSAGGYFLTVTDGVVSSLPNDGTIITSAKIEHGGSGGLAVDNNGCMLGIPVAANAGSIESLGVLISNETILQFMNEIPDDSNNASNSRSVVSCTGSEVESDISGSCVTRSQYCQESIDPNSEWTGSSCECSGGTIWNASKTKCVTQQKYCTDKNGSHALYNSADNSCGCADGYYYSDVSDSCVLHNTLCSQKYSNSIWDGNYCNCPSGYVWNPGNTACVTQTVSNDLRCQTSYGSSSYYTGQTNAQGGPTCDCRNGSSWNSARTMCVSDADNDSACKSKYGDNTYYTGKKDTAAGTYVCDCKSGYYWNDARTACYSSAQYDQGCKTSYGSGSYYSTYSDKCTCSYGYTYSSVSNYCIANQ